MILFETKRLIIRMWKPTDLRALQLLNKEFNHPNLPKTNWLSRHVLYQLDW